MIADLSIIKKFHKAAFAEALEKVDNPGIGWYHVYTFVIGKRRPKLYVACEEENIVLLLIDISEFREKEISAEALMDVRQIFHFFAEHRKDMIVRFTYDTEGRGMEKEPESGDRIREHIRSLGSAVSEYQEHILVLQGLLVGNWGEMHGSRFLSEKWLTKLAKEMLEATAYHCPVAVRTPAQFRMLTEQLEGAKGLLTVFNDGIFGSETDLGTYASGERGAALSWQEETLRFSYTGGEALIPQTAETAYEKNGVLMTEDLRKMHLSYLNSVHQKELLEQWKKEKLLWQKKEVSVYEYVGAHLGYRFVVRNVKWKKGSLWIRIENVGFANLCEEATCQLRMQLNGREWSIAIDTDPRRWECRKETVLEVKLLKEDQIKGTRCTLQLFRKKDGQVIHFANQNAGAGVLLGQF